MTEIRGYKVFNNDWTYSPNGNTKRYTCPGKFEEKGFPDLCNHGMHFYEKLLIVLTIIVSILKTKLQRLLLMAKYNVLW